MLRPGTLRRRIYRTLRRASPLQLALGYIAFGVLWILVLAPLLELVAGGNHSASAEIAKNALFVALTGMAIYGLARIVGRRGLSRPGHLPRPSDVWVPFALFALLAAGILISGSFVYEDVKRAIKEHQQGQLNAIAQYKLQQLANWLEERRADAEVISRADDYPRGAQRWLNGEDVAAEGRLRDRLLITREAYRYRAVWLLDVHGMPRLGVGPTEIIPLERRVAMKAMAEKRTLFGDFHWDEANRGIELNLFAPLLDKANGVVQPIGAVYFEIDPAIYLYPLLSSWPVPSRTAQTLLVRRDGDRVIYLNRLDSRKHPLSVPVDTPDLPAALAVQGHLGLLEGIDHQGHRVLAVANQFPNSPWCMVVTIDTEEIYGPVRQVAQATALLAALFLAGAAAAVALWWQQQRARFAAWHYKEALERQQLGQRFDYLAKYANDIILLMRPNGIILEANERAAEAYGYAHGELVGMEVNKIEWVGASLAECVKFHSSDEGGVFEAMHRRRDGSVFPVEASVRLIGTAPEQVCQAIIRDITERKEAESRLRESEARLREAQRIGRLGYWELNVETRQIEWTDEVYEIFERDRSLGPPSYEEYLAYFDPDEAERLRSYVARASAGEDVPQFDLRLRFPDGRVRYHSSPIQPVTNRAGRVLKLTGITQDITERRLSEERLRESEQRLREAQHMGRLGYWEYDVQDDRLTWSEEMFRLFERDGAAGAPSMEELLATYFDTSDAERIRGHVQTALAGQTVSEYDMAVRLPSGRVGFQTAQIRPVLGDHGRVVKLLGTVQDITERKRADDALREAERFTRSVIDSLSENLAVVDRHGRIVIVNESWRSYAREHGGEPGATGPGCNYFAVCLHAAGERSEGAMEALHGMREVLRGERASYLMEYPCPSGSRPGWFQMQVQPLKLEYGNAIIVSHSDITAAKLAEQALKLSEQRLKLAQRIGRIGYWELEVPGGRITWSDEVFQLYERHPALGPPTFREYLRLYCRDSCSDVVRQLQRAMTEPDAQLPEYDAKVRTHTGRVAYHAALIRPARDAEGRVVKLFGTVQDITDRKHAEEALKQSEQRFAKLVQALPVGVFETDAQGMCVFTSNELLAMTGLEEEQCHGTGWTQSVHPDDREQVVARWKEAVSHKAPLPGTEYRFVHRDGHVVWALAEAVPVLDGERLLGYVGSVTDITERKTSEEALGRSERRLKEAQRLGRIGDWEMDVQTRTISWSEQMYELFDRPPDAGPPSADELLSWYDKEDADRIRASMRLAVDFGEGSELDLHLRLPSGRTFWHSTSMAPANEEGTVHKVFGVLQDITERKRAEEQLRLAAQVFESSSEAILILGQDGRIMSANRAFGELTGYAEQEVVGQTPSMIASSRYDAAFLEHLCATLGGTDRWQGEIWNRRKNNSVYPAWASISAVRDGAGRSAHFVFAFSDITERKAAAERINFLAHYDALTRLPNRILFQERLDQAIANAHRHRRKVALMFLDLDRFKSVNDSLGHHVGDLLLKSVAERLKHCVREADTVARLGGDEFVVIAGDLHDADGAIPIAQKILDTLAPPHRLDGYEVTTTPSIGIALFPDDSQDGETLVKDADVAMYHAKETGRNNYQFYSEEMNTATMQRVSLESGLRRALEQHEFVLHFQPLVELATGKIVGAEALLRWANPEHGLLLPDQFIDIAEESGLIVDIGEWVLRQACATNRNWQLAGLRPIVVSVNLSALQFRQKDLPQRIADALSQARLESRYLELELTEGTIMQRGSVVMESLRTLKEMGLKLAVDDFGTGYSSLSYLKNFPIARLKIDQSFVRNLPGDRDDAAITSAIINMAKALELSVIAEGVESAEVLPFLRSVHCDAVQGFYFGKPIPAQEFAELLRRAA